MPLDATACFSAPRPDIGAIDPTRLDASIHGHIDVQTLGRLYNIAIGRSAGFGISYFVPKAIAG